MLPNAPAFPSASVPAATVTLPVKVLFPARRSVPDPVFGNRKVPGDGIVQLKLAGALGDADCGVAGESGSTRGRDRREGGGRVDQRAGASDAGSLEIERCERFAETIGVERAAGDRDGGQVKDLIAAGAAKLSKSPVDE